MRWQSRSTRSRQRPRCRTSWPGSWWEPAPRRVQQLIRFNSVAVNEEVVTRALHPLHAGDVVTIHFGTAIAQKTALPAGLKVIFEDEHLLVADKPPGLLTIATDKERDPHGLTRSSRSTCASARATRRPASSSCTAWTRAPPACWCSPAPRRIKRALQDQWKTVEKKYQAVVEGCPDPQADTIRSTLRENRAHPGLLHLRRGGRRRPSRTTGRCARPGDTACSR